MKNHLFIDPSRSMYTRNITQSIVNHLFQGKAMVIYGARQVGKTTLCKSILQQYTQTYYLTGDDPYTIQLLQGKTVSEYKNLFSGYRIVCIDEAQMIENIGHIAKLLIDHLPEVQRMLTGSSSFDLANKIHEPLTGRIFLYHLYPLSISEIVAQTGPLGFDQQLSQRLIYGMYPESVQYNTDNILVTLAQSYLYKDILMLDKIKKSQTIIKLVQALAYQIGNQISYAELSQIVGIDPKTVDSYITILEQAFIVFRLPSFSRNLRNELKKSQKVYFWDTGVRNSIIRHFQPLDMRNDVGFLWENFMISEILKHHSNQEQAVLSYFWRTKQQQEVDLVLDYNGKLQSYEFKWNAQKSVSLPGTFAKQYQSEYECVTPQHYLHLFNTTS